MNRHITGAKVAEDTRDIAIATKIKVDNIEDKLEKLTKTVGELRDDLHQRRGAERFAKWFIGGSSGVLGGVVAKFGHVFFNVPIPK
jgi:hypothetical protein